MSGNAVKCDTSGNSQTDVTFTSTKCADFTDGCKKVDVRGVPCG